MEKHKDAVCLYYDSEFGSPPAYLETFGIDLGRVLHTPVIHVEQGKAQFSDWYTAPSGIQKINNELYPSYYNKAQAQTNAKMVFDKVSKKKATNCTPESAKIEVSVTKVTDPISKQEIVTASDGYDATKDDDAHLCEDAKPTASVSSEGSGVSITYTHGRYPLQSVEVRSGDKVVASRQVSSDGSWKLSKKDLEAASAGALTVTVTDTAYYTASSSTNYQP
jgi:penicillin-binding protein 1A